jgi:hypothetical protein
MEVRGANLKKVRQQAESRIKTKPIIRTLPAQVVQPPIVPQEPQIQNAAMFLESINNPPPAITTPQELRNVLSPMSPIGIDNINQEPEDPESGKFLASLIAQGAAGFGAGIMGGSSQDILRSTGMFDRMRESDINRQDRLRQNELLRAERLGERQERQSEKQDRLSEIKRREDQAKLLTDPNSEESKRRREVYKSLGLKVSDNLSFTDLNDPIVLQSLRDKMQEQKLAAMPRGGIGVGKSKEEDEIKSDKKLLGEYSKHTEALQSSIDTMEAVKKLNRSRLGKYTPDFSTFTQAEAGTMDRAAAGLIKVLAGPGTVSDSDAARLGGLVPNSNMTRDLAYETTKRQTLEGINKALAGLRTDRDLGRINETDFRKIINQYNRYIKDPRLELNREINQDGDIIESNVQSSNTKIVTDRQTGKRLEVDQEGNVIREL